MLKRFFQVVMSFILGSQALAQKSDSLNILFIGNSYTHMNEMPSIFKAIADADNKHIYVERNTHSGFSFQQHYERKDMHQAINSRTWDYVILQGYSREFIHELDTIDSASIPVISKILDTISVKSPCANILFYMTWGYKNGYEEKESTNTYLKMTDSIARGYRYMAEHFDKKVMPVGLAWKKYRTNDDSLNLYVEDNAHPSFYGSYLTAATFYYGIFGQLPATAKVKKLSNEDKLQLNKYAKEAVKEDFIAYYENKEYINYIVERQKGKYFLNISTKPLENATIKWYVNDVYVDQSSSFNYKMTKAGKYAIRLVIEDECTQREYTKFIEMDLPKRRRKRTS